MKRHRDKLYCTFSLHNARTSGIEVKCPFCGGLGIVKMDDDHYYFQCTVCGKRRQETRGGCVYRVSEICAGCDRHFRIDVTDKAQWGQKVLRVSCPYCGNGQNCAVQKIEKPFPDHRYERVENGIEPFFGYPLYYQTALDGKTIWALHRKHLLYLIDYIEADLRETPEQSYQDFCGTATHPDMLPKFIKQAKNRETIVKLLKRLL
jgi:endogenous inhibitor of DNA gyrase (YacG/DUF329 family)